MCEKQGKLIEFAHKLVMMVEEDILTKDEAAEIWRYERDHYKNLKWEVRNEKRL